MLVAWFLVFTCIHVILKYTVTGTTYYLPSLKHPPPSHSVEASAFCPWPQPTTMSCELWWVMASPKSIQIIRCYETATLRAASGNRHGLKIERNPHGFRPNYTVIIKRLDFEVNAFITLDTLVVVIFAFDNLLRVLNGTFTIVYVANEIHKVVRHIFYSGNVHILNTATANTIRHLFKTKGNTMTQWHFDKYWLHSCCKVHICSQFRTWWEKDIFFKSISLKYLM